MDTVRRRSAVFFVQYVALLLFGLVWVQFGHVRHRVGDNITLFYVLDGIALCYVGVRGYLVLGKRVSRAWESVWVWIDIVIITCIVRLTGGINSEAALVYFWPIATTSIQRHPHRTATVGLFSAVLYTAATWPEGFSGDDAAKLGTRIFILLLITVLAACFALSEIARVEEMSKLREQVTLADYRARLSQEIHDGIQHYLVAIVARLELARKLMGKEAEQAAKMAVDERFTVRQAADELRYLVRHLRSPVIEQWGFVQALTEHISLFDERSSIAISLHVEGDETTLGRDIEQAAFRIVQEALTNAEKYAEATEARVRLSFGPDLLECVITDDGVGFDPAAATPESELDAGLGLPSMKQRAKSVEGTLQVNSAPGQGTEITFTVPMQWRETTSTEDVGDAKN